MRPAFTFGELRETEKAIIEKDGIPSLILMESAGRNAYEVIRSIVPNTGECHVFIFCGKGNNAGDGFVIARHLAINGIPANIIHISELNEISKDALTNLELLQKMDSPLISFTAFDEFSADLKEKGNSINGSRVLMIDAILGSGLKGSLSEKFTEAISLINGFRKKNRRIVVISVDVPSGLMSGEQVNPVICADHTITMGAVKTEMLFGAGKENCGEISIVPIGVTDDLLNKYNTFGKYDITPDDVKLIFPKRRKASYKYSNGKALIIGGSKGLSGSVIMSSLAALRSGAGAVFAAIPSSISPHFSRKLLEVIKTELDETAEGSISGNSYEKVSKPLAKADAVLIGPGLGLNRETKNFLFELITKCEKNIVIDADALTLISEDPGILLKKDHNIGIILTPHIGEFSKLSGLAIEEIMNDRFNSVREFSAKYGVNIAMKSETTFSCMSSGEIFLNPAGNELLASAGSGDVLSGILVSLLAQTNDLKTAMICGNYLHGLSADIYAEKNGNKQTASQQDLIKLLPGAVTQILN
jgi:NAD(P)H-hydrate epimerase